MFRTFENKNLTDEFSGIDLDTLKQRLTVLQQKIKALTIPVIVLFEGWSASGKGTMISKLILNMDPRGYEVIPISAPTEQEKNHQYLWCFWNKIPRAGHVKIFDRTWYGRILVERVEGFCSKQDWERAFDEINSFEKCLADWGQLS